MKQKQQNHTKKSTKHNHEKKPQTTHSKQTAMNNKKYPHNSKVYKVPPPHQCITEGGSLMDLSLSSAQVPSCCLGLKGTKGDGLS